MSRARRFLGIHDGPAARARLEALARDLSLELLVAGCDGADGVDPVGWGDALFVVIDAPLDDAGTEAAAARVLARLPPAGPDVRPIYVCARTGSIALLQALLRLGAAEVFELGETGALGLQAALRRRLEALSPRRAHLHAVLGLKGGCGASAVALELAFRAARQLGGPQVRLIDLDFGFGRLGERLGLEAVWPRAASSTRQRDAQGAFEPLPRHWSGLEVAGHPFLSPPYPDPGAVGETLDALRTRSDCMVVDLPRSAPALVEAVLARADVITLVSDPSPTGIELARRTLAALDRARSGGGELGVLFNRRPARGEGSQIVAQTLRKTVNFDLLAVLEEDREAFARSVKEREPVHYVAPASAFVRGLGIYLDLLSGSGALEATPAPVRAERA